MLTIHVFFISDFINDLLVRLSSFNSFFFFKKCVSLFCVYECVLWPLCISCWNWFSSSTMWVLRLKLGSSGLVASLSGPDDIFDSLGFPGYLGGLSPCVALTAFSYIHMGLIGS